MSESVTSENRVVKPEGNQARTPRLSGRATRLALAACLFPYALVTAWFLWSVLFTRVDILLYIRMTYNAYTLWLPAWCGVVALVALAGRRSGEKDRRRAAMLAGALGLVCLAARIYATHLEPNSLVVRHVRIRTPKVENPIRLLHVSDIQTDRIKAHDVHVFRRMAELEPDLIIHTGDMLHPLPPATFASELPKIAELWAGVDPPLGKFNAVGDTDPSIVPQLLRGGAAVGGLRTLHAEDEVLKVGKTRLRLMGLTVPQSRGSQGMQAQVAGWLAQGEGEHDFNILFGHAPDYVLFLDGQKRVDLCLAGHTHGGQIRVPFFGPLITFSQVPRPWARGFHKTPGFRLNVSAGTGAEHHAGLPAIRVNCPPEITLIELLPEEKKTADVADARR